MQKLEEMNNDPLKFGERCKFCCMYHWRGMAIILIPLVFLPFMFVTPVLLYRCVFTLLVMSFYWLTKAIPLYITALIPMVAFPLMGVLDSNAVSKAYFGNPMFFFMGAFFVALSIEYCNLHTRVALASILSVGCSARKLHLGIILVTTFVSMWMSNAAVVAMTCPIIKTILTEMEGAGLVKLVDEARRLTVTRERYPSRLAIAFYLSTAYAAEVGGFATLIGTETNVLFKGLLEERFQEYAFLFSTFTTYSILPMVVLTILNYFWIEFVYLGLLRPNSKDAQLVNIPKEGQAAAKAALLKKYDELGNMSGHEIQVAVLSIAMILLLLTHDLHISEGWASIMNDVNMGYSFAVMLVGILAFVLPQTYIFFKYYICRRPNPERTAPSLINWGFIQKNMPWGLMLLLGGGIGLAEGITEGFRQAKDLNLKFLEEMSPIVVQFLCILLALLLTAFTSNLAVCAILIPILFELSVILKMNPMYLGLPVILAISTAYHFPVSSISNTIVSEEGNISTLDMAVGGIGPTIFALIVFFVMGQTLAHVVISDYTSFPAWAEIEPKTK